MLQSLWWAKLPDLVRQIQLRLAKSDFLKVWNFAMKQNKGTFLNLTLFEKSNLDKNNAAKLLQVVDCFGLISTENSLATFS